MKLYSLLKNIKCRVVGSYLVEVGGLYHNDKDVKSDGVFFCIKGENFNGSEFIKNAISNGAVAIVSENEISGLRGITQIIVRNVRKTMSLMACNFYGNPAGKLKILGVTGTNGKTTTTHILAGLLDGLGKNCGIIGTNGISVNGIQVDTGMTTPDPIELQKIFAKMVRRNIEYVCMEVSAHACYLDKLDGFVFDAMIFTNLTEDHLDFFKTMENYFMAKEKIFQSGHTKLAIINVDDDYGKRLAESINIPQITYSIYNNSDKKASDLKIKNYKQEFSFDNKKLVSPLLGEFNVYNLISAISCLNGLGFNLKNLQDLIFNLKQPAGRFNTMVINKKLFIIDYAHTPDGLENILRLCKQIADGKKIISVFGCGGNRETQKRAKMGEISSKYADFTVITSDNPRFEDRETIAKEIEKGVINSNYIITLDRGEAIKIAYKMAEVGDLILVAGKGAENYIDEKGVKTPYSDFDEIKKLEN